MIGPTGCALEQRGATVVGAAHVDCIADVEEFDFFVLGATVRHHGARAVLTGWRITPRHYKAPGNTVM